MVLICFHLVNFRTHNTFLFSDLYQDFLVRRYQFYFYRDSKRKVERTQYFHFIDTFSTQNSLLFSIFSWFLYTTSVIDRLHNIIIYVFHSLLYYNQDICEIYFHSKFIEPSINTHIVKHCDGINMFSSSEFLHIRDFSIF